MTPDFLRNLVELVKLLPQIRELCTRQPPLQEAIVTDNNDPTGMRRIRVTREAQGGQSQSDWIPAGRATCFSDEPIPPVGTMVLIGLVNGDPHKPYYIRTLSNATNPPDVGQLSPVNDNTTQIPGDDRQHVSGNRFIEVKGEKEEVVTGDSYLVVKGKKYSITQEYGEILVEALAEGVGTIRMEAADLMRFKQGEAYAQMSGGVWEFSDKFGQKWTMGGGGLTQEWVWDLNGGSIRIINCTGFSINDNAKQVCTIGSTDSDGDTQVTRGW